MMRINTIANMKLLKQLLLNTEPTKNNRRYPIEVLQTIQEQINSRDENTNLGTMGYPEGWDVSLSKVAFKYSNAVIENGCLYVDIETIPTANGVQLKAILEADADIRFRPAGEATLKGEMPVETHNLLGVPKLVEGDYKLITIAAITPDEDGLWLLV